MARNVHASEHTLHASRSFGEKDKAKKTGLLKGQRGSKKTVEQKTSSPTTPRGLAFQRAQRKHPTLRDMDTQGYRPLKFRGKKALNLVTLGTSDKGFRALDTHRLNAEYKKAKSVDRHNLNILFDDTQAKRHEEAKDRSVDLERYTLYPTKRGESLILTKEEAYYLKAFLGSKDKNLKDLHEVKFVFVGRQQLEKLNLGLVQTFLKYQDQKLQGKQLDIFKRSLKENIAQNEGYRPFKDVMLAHKVLAQIQDGSKPRVDIKASFTPDTEAAIYRGMMVFRYGLTASASLLDTAASLAPALTTTGSALSSAGNIAAPALGMVSSVASGGLSIIDIVSTLKTIRTIDAKRELAQTYKELFSLKPEDRVKQDVAEAIRYNQNSTAERLEMLGHGANLAAAGVSLGGNAAVLGVGIAAAAGSQGAALVAIPVVVPVVTTTATLGALGVNAGVMGYKACRGAYDDYKLAEWAGKDADFKAYLETLSTLDGKQEELDRLNAKYNALPSTEKKGDLGETYNAASMAILQDIVDLEQTATEQSYRLIKDPKIKMMNRNALHDPTVQNKQDWLEKTGEKIEGKHIKHDPLGFGMEKCLETLKAEHTSQDGLPLQTLAHDAKTGTALLDEVKTEQAKQKSRAFRAAPLQYTQAQLSQKLDDAKLAVKSQWNQEAATKRKAQQEEAQLVHQEQLLSLREQMETPATDMLFDFLSLSYPGMTLADKEGIALAIINSENTYVSQAILGHVLCKEAT
jgi:hypothetical protein